MKRGTSLQALFSTLAIDAVLHHVTEPREGGPDLDRLVGLPDPTTARRLLGGLRDALWA